MDVINDVIHKILRDPGSPSVPTTYTPRQYLPWPEDEERQEQKRLDEAWSREMQFQSEERARRARMVR